MCSIRRTIAVCVLIGLLSLASLPLPARSLDHAAAGGSWSAWLYNRDQGRLVHVFPDGLAPVEMMFPLPPGTSRYPDAITISRDGAYFAACLTDDSGIASVRVYDIYHQEYVAAYTAGGPLEACSLSRYAFSEDNTQVAFGVFNHWPNTPGDTRPDWELLIMEVDTSAILYHLTSSDPAITTLGIETGGHLPLVETFQMATTTYPGVISFKPVPWATEGMCEYNSLIWQLSSGSASGAVSSNGPYGKVSLDVLLPNSEITWVDTSAEFTPAILIGPGCPYNVVMTANKTGSIIPIYHDGTNVLWGSRFIADGQMIAVNAYSSASDASSWVYVDRNGSVYAMPDAGQEVWGTPDGYVSLATGITGAPEVRYHRLTTGEMFVLWNGLSGEYWDIIWVNPLAGGAGLPAFAAISPSDLPAANPGGVVTLGTRVSVYTTAGDTLRARTGPGLGYAVAAEFPLGTQLTVMEGPLSADGYTWWRVQADNGNGGWSVEGVIEGGVYLQTLIPIP